METAARSFGLAGNDTSAPPIRACAALSRCLVAMGASVRAPRSNRARRSIPATVAGSLLTGRAGSLPRPARFLQGLKMDKFIEELRKRLENLPENCRAQLLALVGAYVVGYESKGEEKCVNS